MRSQNPKVTVIPMRECLFYGNDNISFLFPGHSFNQHNATKQRAANTRWNDDPLQNQKMMLKQQIQKKLNSEFAPPKAHEEIYAAIQSNHMKWLQYVDKTGNTMKIKKRMALDIIKDVLTETGQPNRISGKFYVR